MTCDADHYMAERVTCEADHDMVERVTCDADHDMAEPASATYVSRKSQAGETVHLCEMEKSVYQRPVSRADPIYYPTPYATTHIADGPCRKSLEAVERELQDEPQYATVKRTPRPPKSDVHIYHYPGNDSKTSMNYGQLNWIHSKAFNKNTRMDPKRIKGDKGYKQLFIDIRQKIQKGNQEAYLPLTFPHNHQIYLGIYLKAGPTCLNRLGRNHVPAH
ncbi:hypothetical protein AVEN_139936-1 [Araneus ventricosus]|uniref:Uncharacterized protein n=1 Tax=Araneus ventricosus TaxID=182803 RepID=A0A4Y2W1U6_ARAVE|nr:hypothetical protein AVEN_139936-1 [Araneus ventricosus]